MNSDLGGNGVRNLCLMYINDLVNYFLLLLQNQPCGTKQCRGIDTRKSFNVMDAEYNALIESQTWEIVDLPVKKRHTTCRRIYKLKMTNYWMEG